jgi:hypothetical protein
MVPNLVAILFDSLLDILIPPPHVFSFMLLAFFHPKHLPSYLPGASSHLRAHAIHTSLFVSWSLCNHSLFKGMLFLPFQLQPLCSYDLAPLPSKTHAWKRKSATTRLWCVATHSPGFTLQSKALQSILLVSIKSIWLEFWALLKVTKCFCLFLKKVLALKMS